ncbi:choice-of-anchor D domain-containing protein [Allokutzneria sp. NRRL B-24872]|uniref:choice-of-anchor D domain-containing protein n=1 Tax=Allokutzneria sp. NRRL B-24872 TaxID=1137961 RepID=UPI000A3AF1E9|nr:choice-of-anchor D domain-containing protein [Allokutzneria sp. NRRL B-24872]
MRRFVPVALVVTLVLSLSVLPVPSALGAVAPGVTTRLGPSTVDFDVSEDGRFAAFSSTAALAPLAVAGQSNVYVRDTRTGVVTLLSKGSGVPADGPSQLPSISADGRYVAFETQATNLGTTDRDSTPDVVVCDRGNGGACTFVGQRPIGPGVGDTRAPVLNADASVVLWVYRPIMSFSFAPRRAQAGVVGGDELVLTRLDKDAAGNVLAPTRFEKVTMAPPGSTVTGVGSHSISADGKQAAAIVRLAPESFAVVALPLDGGPVVRVPSPGALADSVISSDGRKIAFTSDRHATVFDRASGTTTIVSRDTSGAVVDGTAPSLSADGRYVSFATAAPNVHDGASPPEAPASIVTRDLVQDERRARAGLPRLPAALTSPSTRQNCAPANSTCPGNGTSSAPKLAPNGSSVIFVSAASDLVSGDDNGTEDAFLRTFTPGLTSDPRSLSLRGSTPAAVAFRHNGIGPLEVSARVVGNFEVYPTETCSARTLHAGEECAVSVRFRRTTPGTSTGRLEVVLGGGGVVAVPLTGTVDDPGDPEDPGAPEDPGKPGALEISPHTVDFGSALVGAQGAVKSVELRNTGDTAVRITKSVLTDSGHPGDYALTSNCASVPARGTCAITVRHQPLGALARHAVLQIEHSAEGARALVLLVGTGTPSTLTVTPAVGRPDSVVTVAGTGFPPGSSVTVTLVGGPEKVAVIAAADGAFKVPMLIFRGGAARIRTAVAVSGSPLVRAERTLLVQVGSVAPPDLVSRR